MNSKERVSAVLSGKRADKVPLGFYLVDCDIIEKVIGRKTFVRNNIGKRLALAAGRRDEVADSLKEDTVEFYRKIDCADIILPKEAELLPPKDYEPEKLEKIDDCRYKDGAGRIWQVSPVENAMLCVQDPTIRNNFTKEEFESPFEVKPIDDSCFEAVDYLIQELGKDKHICSKADFTVMPWLGGFDTGMMLYASDPGIVYAANKRITATHNALDVYNIRKGTDSIFIENDMGGTNGPFISPRMFRELCLPFMRERVNHLKKFHEHVLLHSCGRNIDLVDMYIESGICCYQSLQTTAGMNIDILKNRFGGRISFWGGISLEVLIGGTTDDARKEVRNALEQGNGGGFILGPSHSIAYGTKYDNFMALLDEFVKLRDKYN